MLASSTGARLESWSSPGQVVDDFLAVVHDDAPAIDADLLALDDAPQVPRQAITGVVAVGCGSRLDSPRCRRGRDLGNSGALSGLFSRPVTGNDVCVHRED